AAKRDPSSRSRPADGPRTPRPSRATAALGPSRQETVLPTVMGGVMRAIARQRPSDRNRSLTVRRLHRRAIRITRRIVDRLAPVPTHRPHRIGGVAPRHIAPRRDAGPRSAHDGSAGLLLRVAGLHPWFRSSSRLRFQRRLIKVRLRSERALPMLVAVAVII